MKLFGISITLVGLLTALPAFGHFQVESEGIHNSRNGRYRIKTGPCGVSIDKDKRSNNIYTYAPGEVVEIKINEYIPHPGYYRVAFDNDGVDDFINPQSVLPLNRECMDTVEDRCGATDFYNFPGVLLDNIEATGEAKRKKFSIKVTMPDVECDSCTLQVLQVMTDAPGIHAPYDPAFDSDDLYYQCIDIVLKK